MNTAMLAAVHEKRERYEICSSGTGQKSTDPHCRSGKRPATVRGLSRPVRFRTGFVQAIRVVNQGSVWAPRRVLSMFIERVSSAPGRIFPAGRVTFTDREKQVLEMLVAGRSNKEIGAALGIEERTVKAHVAKLMRKVGVQNRIALSVHAITHSLVSAK